jgi:hypothetical protein
MRGMNKASMAAREKWSRIVESQQRSGMSVARFCDERGLWASSFFAWRRKLGGKVGAAERMPLASEFVEAKVRGVDDVHGGGVTIELVGGQRILVGAGFDRRVLQDVIEVLQLAGGSS